jgi:hypothetical protein
MPPVIIEKIQSYIAMWAQSDAASRVDQVEGFSINHGFEQYQGKTIPEYIQYFLEDFLLFLRENPGLLPQVVTDEEAAARVDKFLAEEQAKIDEAARLTAQIRSYRFGILDPRYHRDTKQLHAVVKSFRINETMPSPYELPN